MIGWCRFLLVSVLLIFLSSSTVAQDSSGNITVHVVQRGETLFRIAQRYSLTVDDLARVNSITNPSSIMVGQRLLIPLTGSAPADEQTHIVRAGETLPSIAQRYGVTVQDLMARNQIADANVIYVGQMLHIGAGTAGTPTPAPEITLPAESAEPAVNSAPLTPTPILNQGIVPTTTPADQAVAAQPLSAVHTVQRGETLFRIATAYGVSVYDLARANNIADPTIIYAGQQLIIPAGGQAEPAALDLPDIITALDVRPQTLVEGQSFRVHLTTREATSVTASFMNRSLSAASERGSIEHTFLQGIPVFTSAGVYPLELTMTGSGGTQTHYTLNLQVLDGRYGSEYIRLMAGRDGLLDPTLEQTEQNLIASIMGSFTPERFFNGPMSLPAAATVISSFGTRRSYNGGAFDRYHSGTDFAGAPGTPVLAAAPGRVVFADTLSVRGMATIIDHGWGVFTGYWHQSQQYVHVGDVVTTGQVIGAIGATGRVTGAHLHWELWVGGVAVDPMQWVRLSFL